MRRPALLALVSGLVGFTLVGPLAAPAAAHICPVPALIPVGVAATVAVGVTVENATVPDVEIDMPRGLRITRVDPKYGWVVTRRASVLRYRGGPITAFTCAYFSIGVIATTRGAFGIPVVQRDAGGTVVARSTPDLNNSADRVLDQFVYAGVPAPATAGTSKGISAALLAGIALVVVGGFTGAVTVWRSRRARSDEIGDDEDEAAAGDRDAELRARIERFRTRAPDRL